MSFMLWQHGAAARIASSRRVLRAAEVPPLLDAHELCRRLTRWHDEEAHRLEALAREAREAAHAQGLAEGQVQGLREAQERLAETLVSLAQSSAEERERLQGEIAGLALQVVRKLLGSFAEDQVLAALAETAAHETLPARPIALVVHPDECERVRARLGLDCEVRADAACEAGTCRIETELGSVDASLESQLARLASAWGVAP
ncbi:MAG TPA: FliH/SctL family protein [Albitalea sp.]|uniref:FliH/SctL family protein n=1 Tax=Piscinibacter sp. TaxID=1903157 RepID=UPI002ED0F59D